MASWFDMATNTKTEVAEQILDELSRTVLVVGALLDDVFKDASDFEAWVEDNLPIQPRTAERVRAMALLYQFREGHPELPPAWSALWSLG